MIKILDPEEIETIHDAIGAELYARLAACRHMCAPVRDGYVLRLSFFDVRRDKNKEELVSIYCSGEDAFFFTHSARCRTILETNAGGQDSARCVARFFAALTTEDIDFLEQLESEIETLEDVLLTSKKPVKNTENKIIRIRRRLLRMKRYYEQLGMVLGELAEDDTSFFDKETRRQIRYTERHVAHLLDSVLHLRECITQVREAYQAQIDIEQNQVMKVFTVLTAVFLPLTLIVGWYGMNFTAMPEFEWRYGYLYVILLSVSVCSLCMILFKHKKWF